MTSSQLSPSLLPVGFQCSLLCGEEQACSRFPLSLRNEPNPVKALYKCFFNSLERKDYITAAEL